MEKEIKKIMTELNLSKESFAEIIYEVSKIINSTDYRYCKEVWSFNDMYQEYLCNSYTDAEKLYQVYKNISKDEFVKYVHQNHPEMYDLYFRAWGLN